MLSTVMLSEALAVGAEFPARSVAVPDAMETVRAPLPVRLSSVIVRLSVPVPETDLLPAAAVPVAEMVTLSPTSVTLSAPV